MFATLFALSTIYSAQAGILSIIPGVHECQQGHKCVYYRGGSLLETIGSPGYQVKIPFITSHQDIQVTWQTDKLNKVLCGSSQGGKAFLDIEVVNKLDTSEKCILKTVSEHTINYDKPLIFDYIPSEVAQFCKDYTLDDIVIREFDKLDEVLLNKLRENVASYDLSDCLEIKKVRISRPQLDDEMRKKFEAIEHEQKQKALAIQKKETEKIKLESELQREVMEKERQQKTAEIEMKIQRAKVEAEAERQNIINQMESEKLRKKAETERYRLEQIAAGNEALFSTPGYIQLESFKAIHHNSKLIFGDMPKNAIVNLGGYTYPIPHNFQNIVNSSSTF